MEINKSFKKLGLHFFQVPSMCLGKIVKNILVCSPLKNSFDLSQKHFRLSKTKSSYFWIKHSKIIATGHPFKIISRYV